MPERRAGQSACLAQVAQCPPLEPEDAPGSGHWVDPACCLAPRAPSLRGGIGSTPGAAQPLVPWPGAHAPGSLEAWRSRARMTHAGRPELLMIVKGYQCALVCRSLSTVGPHKQIPPCGERLVCPSRTLVLIGDSVCATCTSAVFTDLQRVLGARAPDRASSGLARWSRGPPRCARD